MNSSIVGWNNYSLFNTSLKKYKSIALFILVTNWASVLAATSDNVTDVSSDNFIRCTPVPFLTIHENPQEGNDPQTLSSKINSIVQDEQGQIKKSHNSKVVTVSCQSSQPITWQYSGPKTANSNKIVKSVKVSRLTPWNRTTSCYQANITLEVPPGVYTGWYTCLVIPEEDEDTSGLLTHHENMLVANNAQTSFYLYRNEKSSTQLMVTYPINTLIPRAVTEVIIPWLWNVPITMLKFSKLDIQSSEFLSMDEESIGFDNGRGVKLTMPGSVLGTYKYALNDSEVIFQVVLPEKAERSNDIVVQFNGQESCDNVSSPFTCESRNGTEPQLHLQILDCENPIHCDLLWETSPQYLREVISGNGSHIKRCPSGQSGVVICGSEDGMTYQYVHYFLKEDNQLLLLNSTEPFAGLDPISMDIDISHWNEEEYYCVNNTIEIFCKANQYLFTPELQLIVGYKNGSLGSIVGMVLNSSETVHSGYHHYNWTLNVTSVDITSYNCLASLIRSRQWMNKTIKLKVLYPVPPNILKNDPLTSSSTVAFYDTDVDRVLSCAATGIPTPEIEWFKNNNKFSLMYKTIRKRNDKTQTRGDLMLTISSLYIPKMMDLGTDLPGNWTCRASNGYHPDASYSIDVKVRKSWWIWMTTVVLICAASMASVYIRQRYRAKKAIRELEELIKKIPKKFDHILSGNRESSNNIKLSLETLRGAKKKGSYAHTASVGTDEDFIGLGVIHAAGFPPNYLLDPENLIEDPNSVLGAGSYGKLYKGIYKNLNGVSTEVAIKTPHITNDPSETKRNKMALVGELPILAYIGAHEFVVSFIGGVIFQMTHREKIQVVLELCDTSLEAYLRAYRCYFVDETVVNTDNRENDFNPYKKFAPEVFKTSDLSRWSFQIACAMQHLVSLMILHRDMAARNVLLVRKNGQLDVRITDFGLSKKLPESHVSYEPQSEWKCFHWRYLAPELFNTPRKFSQATDVWAFGITMWEIFTLAENEPYHEFESNNATYLNAIQNEHLRNAKPKYAETAIYDIMQACWDPEPTLRPTFTKLIQIFQDGDLLPKGYLETIPTTAYQLPDERKVFDYIERFLSKTEQSNAEGNQSWSKWFSGLFCRLCKSPALKV